MCVNACMQALVCSYSKCSSCSLWLCDCSLFLLFIYLFLFSLPGFVASVGLISCVWLPSVSWRDFAFSELQFVFYRCVWASDVPEMSQPMSVMMPPGLLCLIVSAKQPAYFYLSFRSLICNLVSSVLLPQHSWQLGANSVIWQREKLKLLKCWAPLQLCIQNE